jgi:hypothetical protein
MSNVAIIVFVAACAVVAVFVGMQKTVIRGEAMAAQMMEIVNDKNIPGIRKIECTDRIPVKKTGAMFECMWYGTDGSTARFEYKMKRDGKLEQNKLSETGPSLEGN